MTLIEGVGDEVINFFLLLAIAFIALIAWWSTNLSERPLVRTVFILERRTIRQAPIDTQTLTSDINETSDILQESDEIVVDSKTSQSSAIEDTPVGVSLIVHDGATDENDCVAQPQAETNPEETVENVETEEVSNCIAEDGSTVRNRLLSFFEVKREERNLHNQNECAQTATDERTPQEEKEEESSDEGNIRIRLKYLNDDQKLVEGKLQEQLGDFKRRHFSIELAGRKLVRLIFNGQVLQEDTKTLQNCGLFDNCVVHCLVHSRTPPPSPDLNRARSENQAHGESAQHWDLGSILFASLSLLLGLAWYGRYHYAQLYTATTTVALVGLTGIFTVSLIGMYMPDTDGVRT